MCKITTTFQEENGALTFYSAIRVPQSTENNQLKRLVKEGRYTTEDLQHREQNTLKKTTCFMTAVRADLTENSPSSDGLYNASFVWERRGFLPNREEENSLKIEDRAHRTLSDAPWKKCSCAVCERASIEVVIFRASNRNKRRGIHNLAVYQRHLKKLKSKRI